MKWYYFPPVLLEELPEADVFFDFNSCGLVGRALILWGVGDLTLLSFIEF
jgi:hypothetical protein